MGLSRLKALRCWLGDISSTMVKHRKDRATRYHFTDSDSDDGNGDGDGSGAPSHPSSLPPSVTTTIHRHVDYSFSSVRPSVRTSYVSKQESASKRAQTESDNPPAVDPPASSLLSVFVDGVDLDYEYYESGVSLDGEGNRQRRAGDRPLLRWIPGIDTYLAEMLRLKGRGDQIDGKCHTCQSSMAAFRCADCFTTALFCAKCLVTAHQRQPLHRVIEWKDGFFHKTSLKSLGLRVQLGHEPGNACVNPKRVFADDFVILDVHGIHEVAVDFCSCENILPHSTQLLRARWYPATTIDPKTAATFDLLENFHLLSTQSMVSGYGFYISLALTTDNTGTASVRDCYPAFMDMVRQWRHLKMLKRSGRGHAKDAATATAPGECAVECPACPHPSKNLPADWLEAPKGQRRWLYRLFLSIDANFRLKRKKVSNDASDPSLNHRCAYFVDEAAYQNHLGSYGHLPTEKHSQCNNHHAVKLANSKDSSHLATTGVGTRPGSVDDLQKGERYVNIDFLLHSSLSMTTVPLITISYDIACQYSINLQRRFSLYGYPTVADRLIRWAVPMFHIAAYQDVCRAGYSLHYLPECGRGRALANLAASSTKEMGPGSRHDVLDDIFADQNWQKVTKLPEALLARIKAAVPEREVHVAAFEEYNVALPSALTASWEHAVSAWEENPLQPNPFLAVKSHITQATARLQLSEEDSEALRTGTAVVLHEHFSSSTMISAGIDLEDQQRRLSQDLRQMHEHATDLARVQMLDRQNTLHRKIQAWSEVQRLFMPAVQAVRARLMNDSTSHLPHQILLLLPSRASLHVPCTSELLHQEWILREAQAHNALEDIRSQLEVHYHMYYSKDRFVCGQRPNTRMNTSIQLLQVKLASDAERYCAAYDTLCHLSPQLKKNMADWGKSLHLLQDSDLRHLAEDEEGNSSESRCTTTWIWRSAPVSLDAVRSGGPAVADSLQESLRIEWCKARARARQWTEECTLLQEEMRRVIAYHDWAEKTWIERAAKVPASPSYTEGSVAYARRQAAARSGMKSFCEHAWHYVKLWVCLGTDSALVDKDTSLPPVTTTDSID
ncbi:hypothetical protein PYCCODRAFT_1448403 [Trametes coccinea BRFM310]|uniref:CxC2-like cysteine cluster KDZ transposase-associated domain-containing protein n=1 Tax=Trametes coccinea (strain BRFM310) TaxID=1353009 RepID=A0A1Y2I687_TRAC3|nr:hypothetical protein PYCCODRAFT_1448403 [Trametes coccinea BRFM310]